MRATASAMEQHTFKNVNNCLNTNTYSYLETSGGQSSNSYFNAVHFFNTCVSETSVAASDSYFPSLVSNTCCSIRHLRQLKTVVFMPWGLMTAVLLDICGSLRQSFSCLGV